MPATPLPETGTSLVGRVAVLTAAGNPVVCAIARRLAVEGAVVLLLTGREHELAGVVDEAAQAGRSLATVEVDLGDVDDVDRVAAELSERHGPPDLVVNNMAMVGAAGVAGPVEAWRELVEANLLGHLNVISAFRPALTASDGPPVTDVVNLVAAEDDTSPERVVYDALSAAAQTLSDRLRRDLGRNGVRVTEILLDLGDELTDELEVGAVERLPRAPAPVTGEDVADLVVYVASLPPHVAVRSLTVGPPAKP